MKVTIAGRELTAHPMRLRLMRDLLEMGVDLATMEKPEKLSASERFDLFVSICAASCRVDREWLTEEAGPEDMAALVQVQQFVVESAAKGRQEPAPGEAGSP